MQLKPVLISFGLIAAATTAIFAQGGKPLSPPAQAAVTINGKTITIKYSAPSMRGRKIIGGLVPYGQVWRTGANESTAFHTDAALDLGGLKVPAGNYTLYTLVEANAWKLIVNKQTGQWGTEYDQSQDLGRVPMKLGKTASPVEIFKITLSATGGAGGKLVLDWENTSASVAFEVK